jgi:hypothetical protein
MYLQPVLVPHSGLHVSIDMRNKNCVPYQAALQPQEIVFVNISSELSLLWRKKNIIFVTFSVRIS